MRSANWRRGASSSRWACGFQAAGQSRVLFNKGDLIPAETLVWTTGNRTHSIVEALGVTKNNNRIQTEPTLRSVSDPEIWSVGDCAGNPDQPVSPMRQPRGMPRAAARKPPRICRQRYRVNRWSHRVQATGPAGVLGRRTALGRSDRGSPPAAGLDDVAQHVLEQAARDGEEDCASDSIGLSSFFPRELVLTRRVFSPDQAERGPERAAAPAPTAPQQPKGCRDDRFD